MAEAALERVDVLMVDPDRNAQSVLRTILGNSGFRNFQVGRSIQEMRNRVDESLPDLLISECEFPDGDFCDFVYSLRHHELGRNPFISIIALTQAPSPDTVSRVSNCGVDHLVVKPFSTAQMVDRIMALMKSRKLYVVTSNYIGPDRRRDSNRESSVSRIAVPNTLRAKALGKASPEDIQRAIDITLAEVNIQKLERYDDEIGFLVDHIVPALENGGIDDPAMQYLERLLYVAGDISRRLTGTKYAHVSELCDALLTVTDSVYEAPERLDTRDIQLMRPLSQAIRVGFGTNEKTVAAAHEISTKALARFREAQAKKTTITTPRKNTLPPTIEPPTDAPLATTDDIAENILRSGADNFSEEDVAAQSLPTGGNGGAKPMAKPDGPATGGRSGPGAATAGERNFDEVFVDSLCAFVRQRLEPWHVETSQSKPVPFVLSTSFFSCFEEAIRQHVGNAIPRNRRMVVLAQGLNHSEISENIFHKLFNEPNAKDNVPRFLWNNWWDGIRSTLSQNEVLLGTNQILHRDAQQIWALIQDGAKAGKYDPPKVQDIPFFKSLFDFTPEDIRNGMTGLQQVLLHEATGEADEGASRNFILAQIENQPPYFGDLLALWAFFTRKDFTPGIQKSLIASTGRTPGERRLVLPFYLRWAPDLTRRNGNH